MVKSPIFNDTLLVPDPDKPGKKMRVSKLLLHISICELHNDLIYEISIYQLKDAIYDTKGNPLISDTSMSELTTKKFEK